MIVRNEAHCLRDCLESVRDWVDEMVVVDTGSTDATVSIAEAAGARVEHLPWPGDFAPARNAALDFVTGDWVLVLDADEQLRKECVPELQKLITNKDVLLVNLLRHEQGALMSPYSQVSRLFRRHPKIKWSRPYHSIIDDSVKDLLEEETQWQIVDCMEPALIHYGYRPELIQKTNKAERLRSAMESWLNDHPGDPYACSKLGALEVEEGSIEKGLNLLKEGLSTCNTGQEKYELLLHLGIALAKNDLLAAESAYRDAISIKIEERIRCGARLNLSALLVRTGKLEEALQLSKNVTEFAPEVFLGWYNLGLIRRKLGDLHGALDAYSMALRLNPFHAETYQNLGIVNLLLGNIHAARKCFRESIAQLEFKGQLNEAASLRRKLTGIVQLEDEAK